MPPYTTLHFENLLWMVGVGLLLVCAVVLARGSSVYSLTLRRRSDAELEQEAHEFGDGLREENRPVPLFIWLVAVGYFVWAVGYVIFCGIYGL